MTAMRRDGVDAQVRATLDHIDHLPPLPEAMVALWRIIDDPDTTLDELCRIVSSDPSLSMSLLRLVNSANFALSRKITTVRESVHFLGFGEVKNLSIAIVVKTGLLLRSPKSHSFDRLLFWRHCVGSAIAAQLLGRTLLPGSADEAFTAGLLADVGLMVLDQAVPEALTTVVAVIAAQPWTMEEAERRVLGCTHSDAGVWLGESWGFSERILVPMAHHPRAGEAPDHRETTALVHLGRVVSLQENPFLPMRRPIDIDPAALEIVGAKRASLELIRADYRREMERVAALLELRR